MDDHARYHQSIRARTSWGACRLRLRITALAIVLVGLSACGGASAVQGFVQQHTQCRPFYYFTPRWSPDGSRIAFTTSDNYSFKPTYLDLIDVNSLAYTRLETFYDGVYGPSWSPDGLYLVVSLARGTDIYVIDNLATSTMSRVIMGIDKTYLEPDWSPDGKHLVMTTNRDGYPAIIVATLTDALIHDGVDLGASYPVIENLSDEHGHNQGTSPRWAPDGRRIAYIRSWMYNPTINVINADGTNETEVVAAYGRMLSINGISWSPDGRKIAYSADNSQSVSVYRINVDGSQNTFFTYGRAPDWSPDGTRIAFIGADSNGFDELFVMNLDGSNKIPLTQNPGNGICFH